MTRVRFPDRKFKTLLGGPSGVLDWTHMTQVPIILINIYNVVGTTAFDQSISPWLLVALPAVHQLRSKHPHWQDPELPDIIIRTDSLDNLKKAGSKSGQILENL